jgi:periplasmic protein TonB
MRPVVVAYVACLLVPASPATAQQAGMTSTATFPPPEVAVPLDPPPSTVINAVPTDGQIIAVTQSPPPPTVILVPSVRVVRGSTAAGIPPMPPVRDVVRPPQPRASAQSYISRDDYPASALAMRAQGNVRFMLVVSPNGRADGCSILASSGWAALDSATCRLMRRRARFTPAIDSHGNPTTGTISQQIRWRLPQN